MAPEGFQTHTIGGEAPPGGSGVRRSSRQTPPPLPHRPRGKTFGRANPLRRAWAWLVRQQRELGWRRFLLRAGGAVGLVLFLYIGFLWFTLPNLDDPASLLAAQSTAITDRNGAELYRLFSEQDRTYVPGDQISEPMRQAIVSIEDERFYRRGCLDLRAMVRVFLRFGQAGGASTLTRQLARNALNLQHENVLNRKLKEIILGCQMESRFSKEKILELYLNWVPFGNNAYGVEQASRRYFASSAKDLTVAQAAVLASIPQRPSYFSPYGRHVHTSVTDPVLERIADGKITTAAEIEDDDVRIGLIGTQVGTGSRTVYIGGRTDQVLKNMLEQEMISEEQRQTALSELQVLVFNARGGGDDGAFRAAHFVLWAKDQVETAFDGTADKGILEQGGLTIRTTLDGTLQAAAEAVVRKHAPNVAKLYGAHNIGLVAMDPATREILAYVGNVDYNDEEHEGKVDMALVPRQPGSSFKPFVYAGVFLKGYSPATVLHDVSTKFGTYQPQNFEGGFWGLTTIRKALGGSRNIPAVKAYFLAGEEDQLLDLVSSMGVTSPKENRPDAGYGPSMALGTAETPLLEMVQGYATLADGGRYKPAVSIQRITDRRGSLLPLPAAFDPDGEGTEVMDPRVAYQITSVLSDPSVRPGDYWRSILTVPGTQAAAKTGTSNKCLERDDAGNCIKRKPDNVWTMGYTPTLVVGVWVGNATADPMSDSADGINVAAPIWKEFMSQAQKILQPEVTTFSQPDGLVQVQASLLSGELPTECTPVDLRKSDLFLREHAPSKADPACVTLNVDKVTGLLASESCPVEAQEQKSFYVPYTPLSNRFPSWEQGVRTWAAGGGVPLPVAPTESCDVSLTPGRLIKPTLTILSPSSNGTATFPSFAPRYRYTSGGAVRQIEIEIDGKPTESFTEKPFEGAIRVPRSVSKNGSHTLTVTLTDEFYNVVTDSVRFTFGEDSSGPDVTVVSPEQGDAFAVGGDVVIRAEADDPEGQIKYVEFYLDDLLLTRKPKVPYELTYPLDIAPGKHVVRAVAIDLAGNSAVDSVSITVSGEGSGSGEVTVQP